ncbi:helix-turn-helix transcriptional regulator [Formosa sp. A9]|uniref:helix-turn-helix transcriptional regulator n=1 Tax=Formosa sp. A9 TaxID=3442641 RepID=UPI003EB6E253
MSELELRILKEKEIFTVKEVALLLNCSKRTVYRNIMEGKLKAINLGDRLTRVKRSDIEMLFKK